MGHHHSHYHRTDSHPHTHHHSANHYQRSFFLAASVNFLFVIGEVIYALKSHSMSLLADAGHNFGDVIGLAFSLAASWLMTKPASERYSYGYKKTTVLAALFNALLLVFTAGIIVYESFLRLFHPTPITEKIIIIVAGLGILINGGSALLFIKNNENDLNVKSAFAHLAGDALIALGVVITGAVILRTNWLWLDPLAGLIVAITILFSTWGLVRDSVNLILDAVPAHVSQQKVNKYLSGLKGVHAVHDLHIWGLSTKETALTAHLIMSENIILSNQDYQKINLYLKQHFKIHHVTLQIEQGDTDNPCIQAHQC